MRPNDTLLVVDDEPAILETYRHYLAPAAETRLVSSRRLPTLGSVPAVPHRLLLAPSGEDAVRLVEAERDAGRRIAGGFFDMKMPGGIDGLETIRRVRAIDPDILVTVVTAYQDRSIDDINALFPGREDEWDYVNKPFTQAEIRQRARNIVSSWARRRAEETQRQSLEHLIGFLSELRRLRDSDGARAVEQVLRWVADLAGDADAFLVSVDGEPTFGGGVGRTAGHDAVSDVLAGPGVREAIVRCVRHGEMQATPALTVLPLPGTRPPQAVVVRHAGAPDEHRRKLLRIFGDNAGGALENLRLVGELRDLNASLEQRVEAQTHDLRQASLALFEVARTDPLTKAGNRLRLREDLEALRGRVVRYGHQYCAALCDVDHFKLYNDHHGHLAGDEALQKVVDIIRATVRSGDAVYRYGGEEFLIILPEQTEDGSIAAIERVRHAVEAAAVPHGGLSPSGVLTISAGISALVPGETQLIEEWLRRADAALYDAKARGRNRVVSWAGEGTAGALAPEPLRS